jgi:hypothetical protein
LHFVGQQSIAIHSISRTVSIKDKLKGKKQDDDQDNNTKDLGIHVLFGFFANDVH